MPLPVVAIVGRPNVGKSSLFNWLAGRRIAIVDPTAGVTRDRVSTIVEADGRFFELIDTGGIGHRGRRTTSRTTSSGRSSSPSTRPHVILFVVDVRDRPGRRSTRRWPSGCGRSASRSSASSTSATRDALALQAAEFYQLGYGRSICRQRRAEPRQARAARRDRQAPAAAGRTRSRRPRRRSSWPSSAGGTPARARSSTAWPQAERVIVSEVPGTTRDSVDVRFERDGKTFIAIDTAGVRQDAAAWPTTSSSTAWPGPSGRSAGPTWCCMFFDAAAVDQPGRQATRRVHPGAPQAGHLRRQQVGPGQGAGDRRSELADYVQEVFPDARLRADGVHHGQGRQERAAAC